MSTIRLRLAFLALPVLALLGGCQKADNTISIAPAAFTEAEVQAIRSQDQIINDEEGGGARVTRPTRIAGNRKSR